MRNHGYKIKKLKFGSINLTLDFFQKEREVAVVESDSCVN